MLTLDNDDIESLLLDISRLPGHKISVIDFIKNRSSESSSERAQNSAYFTDANLVFVVLIDAPDDFVYDAPDSAHVFYVDTHQKPRTFLEQHYPIIFSGDSTDLENFYNWASDISDYFHFLVFNPGIFGGDVFAVDSLFKSTFKKGVPLHFESYAFQDPCSNPYPLKPQQLFKSAIGCLAINPESFSLSVYQEIGDSIEARNPAIHTLKLATSLTRLPTLRLMILGEPDLG